MKNSLQSAFAIFASAMGLVVASPSLTNPASLACAQIEKACRDAGFVQGGVSAGNGLILNCINPIVNGTGSPGLKKPLPEVDPRIVAECRESKNRNAEIVYAEGSTHKICQLIGDIDHETKRPTLNQTASRFGVGGTDEGFSFEHQGKLWFLFGDTWSKLPGRVFGASDAIGFSDDRNADNCIRLNFVTAADGGFKPPEVPGVSLGPFETPNSGFSLDGKVYVIFNTKHPVDRTVLGVTTDGGHTFRQVYEFSRTNFRNAQSSQVVDRARAPGIPNGGERGVLIWGTSVFRKSNPRLAFIPADHIESREATQFFAGLDPSGAPIWSHREMDAQPLFHQEDQPGRKACTGEMSVDWNPFLRKWLMLYNCGTPRGINFRVADRPWGPWSEPDVLFDPWKDGGYCHFMYAPLDWWREHKPTPTCDACQDPRRDKDWGGEYGPYLISRYTKGEEGRSTTIYWVLSTWNPYTVDLMTSTLKLDSK